MTCHRRQKQRLRKRMGMTLGVAKLGKDRMRDDLAATATREDGSAASDPRPPNRGNKIDSARITLDGIKIKLGILTVGRERRDRASKRLPTLALKPTRSVHRRSMSPAASVTRHP